MEPESFHHMASFGSKVCLGIALLAAFAYFLSMILFLTVLSRLDATQAALSNYLIPVFGVLIAAAALGEHLTARVVSGGLVVLASTLLVTVHEEHDVPRMRAISAARVTEDRQPAHSSARQMHVCHRRAPGIGVAIVGAFGPERLIVSLADLGAEEFDCNIHAAS